MNIVVTGASKGIGKVIAEKYAAHGHQIFICSRNAETLRAAASEITAKHPQSTMHFLPADLSIKNEVIRFGKWVLNTGVPDIVVNNAGTFIPGSIYNEPEGVIEQMIGNNLYSAYHLTRFLLPGMIEKKSGHIFNMCSTASLSAYSNGGSYSISKYALAGFSKNLREELKPFGIKVTAVYPGAVYTDSWKASGLPESRFMTAEDIAALVFTTSMLSPQACVEDLILRPLLGDIK